MHQVGAQPINLPLVHFDMARDCGSLIAERVDGNWLFVGKRDFALHPAILGQAAARKNCAVVALAT